MVGELAELDTLRHEREEHEQAFAATAARIEECEHQIGELESQNQTLQVSRTLLPAAFCPPLTRRCSSGKGEGASGLSVAALASPYAPPIRPTRSGRPQ